MGLKPDIQSSYVYLPERRGEKVSMAGGSSSVQRPTIPGVDLDVRELARFLSWLEIAARSGEAGVRLPEPPAFRDVTVTRWTRLIMGLEAGAETVEARLRGAERSVDGQVSQLRDHTLQLAEQLAAVYESTDRPDHAQAIRLRAAGLRLRA